MRIAVEPRTSPVGAAAGDDVGDCAGWGEAKKSHYLLNANCAQLVVQLEIPRKGFRTIAESLLTLDESPQALLLLALDNIEVSANYLKKPEVAEALRHGVREFVKDYLLLHGDSLGLASYAIVGEHPKFMKEGSSLYWGEEQLPNDSKPRVPLLYSDKVAKSVYLLCGRPELSEKRPLSTPGIHELSLFDTRRLIDLLGPSSTWPLTHAIMGLSIANAMEKRRTLSFKNVQNDKGEISAALVAYQEVSSHDCPRRPKITVRCLRARKDTRNEMGALVEAFKMRLGELSPLGIRPLVQLRPFRGAISAEGKELLAARLPSEWLRS
jgi:hypothetical protein